MGGYMIETEAEGTVFVDGMEVPWVDKVRYAADTRRWREFTFSAACPGFYDETTICVGADGGIEFSIAGENILGQISLSAKTLEFLLAQRALVMKQA